VGPQGPGVGGTITYYYDTNSGLDTGPGTYGNGIAGSAVGPGYVYYPFASTYPGFLKSGAVMYPIENYINSITPGNDPFVGPPPSNVGAGNLTVTNTMLSYVAPYDGQVVRVSVNSAYSKGFYANAEFDFIVMDAAGALTPGLTVWNAPYASGKQVSGWSDKFTSTGFKAGDQIYCYVVDTNNDVWGTRTLPVPPDDGLFNITLYLMFYP
jgi:hypothetical protein